MITRLLILAALLVPLGGCASMLCEAGPQDADYYTYCIPMEQEQCFESGTDCPVQAHYHHKAHH
jgi:hypothetical protein